MIMIIIIDNRAGMQMLWPTDRLLEKNGQFANGWCWFISARVISWEPLGVFIVILQGYDWSLWAWVSVRHRPFSSIYPSSYAHSTIPIPMIQRATIWSNQPLKCLMNDNRWWMMDNYHVIYPMTRYIGTLYLSWWVVGEYYRLSV